MQAEAKERKQETAKAAEGEEETEEEVEQKEVRENAPHHFSSTAAPATLPMAEAAFGCSVADIRRARCPRAASEEGVANRGIRPRAPPSRFEDKTCQHARCSVACESSRICSLIFVVIIMVGILVSILVAIRCDVGARCA